MQITRDDALILLAALDAPEVPQDARYVPRLREKLVWLTSKRAPATLNLAAPARAGELGVIAGLRRVLPNPSPELVRLSQRAGDEITGGNTKPRCPRCGQVARALRRYVGTDPVPRPVTDAAECPDHGTFLV